MSTPRELLAEADRLRTISNCATRMADGLDEKHNRGVDIGGVTLYCHAGFPNDLVIVDALRAALVQVAAEHKTRAVDVEARVGVTS
jgi:hypothetical protein